MKMHAGTAPGMHGTPPGPSAQQGRNLLVDLGEQTHRVKLMISDRGSNFTAAFDAVLADSGIRIVLRRILREYEIATISTGLTLDETAPLNPSPNLSIPTGTASEGRLTPLA
jgi:hypothetical protein